MLCHGTCGEMERRGEHLHASTAVRKELCHGTSGHICSFNAITPRKLWRSAVPS